MRTPNDIVTELAPAYQEWKGGEKSKNKLKDEFFEAITAELATGELGEQIVLVEEATSPEEGEAWVEKRHPFFEVTDYRSNPEGMGYEYIITERPEFKDFYIDFDGKTYGRQVAQGPTLIDEEEILDNDSLFYAEVTEYEGERAVRPILEWVIEDDNPNISVYEAIESYFEENNGGKRVLKPIEDLSPDQLAKLQQYAYQGKPVVKLPAPKKAKD